MSFWQWYVRRGRIDRRTWWLHYTVPIAVLGVLAYLADLALGTAQLPSGTATAAAWPYGPLFTVMALLTAPASVSANATRLHDQGIPAWVLLLGLVPLVGPLLLFAANGFRRGQAGPNRFGPAPVLAPGPADGPLYVPPSWT